MELNYHDLSREVLGQWRGGSCIEELTVENNAKAIYFHMSFFNSIPCIQDINFEPLSVINRPAWVKATMDGRLVWWFSRFGGIVEHEQT